MKNIKKDTGHTSHSCRAIVVSCMDFRLRKHLRKWTTENMKDGFDRLAIAGGVKNLAFIIEQVELSYKLHHICEVYLINHEDCGAYGAEGSFEKHKEDLKLAKTLLTKKFKDLRVALLYLRLDGTYIPVR